jgi:hypothetical protein
MQTKQFFKVLLVIIIFFTQFSISGQNNFFDKFSIVTLPYRASSYTLWKDTIEVENVVKNIFEKASQKNIPTFQDFWQEESKEMTIKALQAKKIDIDNKDFAAMNVGYGVILPYSPHFKSVIVHFKPLFMEGSYDYTFLINYDFDGNMIDATQIAIKAGYVDIQTEAESLIEASGKIKTQQKIRKYEKLNVDDIPDLVEDAELCFQIDFYTGKISLVSQKYTGFSGSFVNQYEKWRFLHSPRELKIIYEITLKNETNVQELQVIRYDREKGEILAKSTETQQEFALKFDANKIFFSYNYQGVNKKLERLKE